MKNRILSGGAVNLTVVAFLTLLFAGCAVAPKAENLSMATAAAHMWAAFLMHCNPIRAIHRNSFSGDQTKTGRFVEHHKRRAQDSSVTSGPDHLSSVNQKRFWRIGNQIGAAMIFARGGLRKRVES